LGTLTLGAQNTFVGTTRLNGGTTVLAGGNNTLFYPAATPPAVHNPASETSVDRPDRS